MFTSHGIIRNYDPASDTASVELTGLGVIDTWLTGVRIEFPVNRANVVSGATCTLSLPDDHRLCEATIISVSGTAATSVLSGGAAQKTETGRAQLFLDGTGNGAATVVFPVAFSAAPAVTIQGDELTQFDLSSLSTSGFTATLHSPGQPNSWVTFTWVAAGNA